MRNTRRKTTARFIEEAKSVHGDRYDYSRTVYVNQRTKVVIGCATHGWFEQLPDDHSKGRGCRVCANEEYADRRRIESRARILDKFVAAHGDRYGYSEVDYVDSRTPVKIECREHGVFEQKPVDHVQGRGCPACAQDVRVAAIRVDLSTWLTRFKAAHGDHYDYSRLVPDISTSTKVPIVCPVHGVFHQKPQNHANGEGCPQCSPTYQDDTDSAIRKFVSVHGDRYDYSRVAYVASDQKVEIVCPRHGVFEQTPDSHIQGKGCWHCGVEERFEVSKTSKSAPEETVAQTLRDLGCEITRGYLPGSTKWHYDVIVESHKLVVEFNGTYWHSYPRTRRGAHYHKRKHAEERGYRLVTIWEDDWRFKRDRMVALLRRMINGPDTKIGARQTTVVAVPRSTAKKFHEDYHVQGFRVSSADQHYGLYDGRDLVAVASFDSSGLLHRYTVLDGLSIAGGLLKCVKAFRRDHGPLPITTYCDRDQFTGSVYRAAGFQLVGSGLTMTYVVKGERQRRERYMKHKLPDVFADVDVARREIDICADNGVFACWNSGTDKFVLVV